MDVIRIRLRWSRSAVVKPCVQLQAKLPGVFTQMPSCSHGEPETTENDIIYFPNWGPIMSQKTSCEHDLISRRFQGNLDKIKLRPTTYLANSYQLREKVAWFVLNDSCAQKRVWMMKIGMHYGN